jgi:hypothetical protein
VFRLQGFLLNVPRGEISSQRRREWLKKQDRTRQQCVVCGVDSALISGSSDSLDIA